jgi:hypothetical protein
MYKSSNSGAAEKKKLQKKLLGSSTTHDTKQRREFYPLYLLENTKANDALLASSRACFRRLPSSPILKPTAWHSHR